MAEDKLARAIRLRAKFQGTTDISRFNYWDKEVVRLGGGSMTRRPPPSTAPPPKSSIIPTALELKRIATRHTLYERPEIMQAGVGAGLIPLAKTLLPHVKTGVQMIGGYLTGRAAEEVFTNGNGDDTTGRQRYGGLTDLGLEGPGVFRPQDVTPTMYGTVTKQWVANGTLFQRNEDGTISVQKKDGTVKTYRPYKPIVFGKKLDARKLARVAKKHRAIYKELHKLFGTKTRTVKK